ncbi:MAG TPA: type IV toxin-antitoxin system AbiEi family antitoxin domain-containing protein [Solirubrobacterales bacterium]|jgi:very-short-patch-repair endonuclease
MADLGDNERQRRPLDARIARLAADQWGVLSVSELRDCGLSPDAVALRVRNGRLHPIHRGVYAVGHPAPPLEGHFLAAVKACGSGAFLSHYSAAALWGLVRWDDRYPEVTVVGTVPRRHPGIRAHRTRRLSRWDVSRPEGIPVTAPPRTLVDLASILPYKPLRRAVRQAQSLGRANLPQLVAAIRRAGRRSGLAKLKRVLASGPAPTRSELEDVVLDLILDAGLRAPRVNEPMLIEGRRVIPDFRWPEQQLVVEADGAAWHDNPTAREDDVERQALLETHGEHVVRVTWCQAITQPHQTLARLRAAGAPRDRSEHSL